MSAEFNPIHEPKIYEGIEAQQRLAELGVPLEVVREALAAGDIAARQADEYHPVTAAGTMRWFETVRMLRQGLAGRGWATREIRNSPRSFSPAGDTAIVAVSGDWRTGNRELEPKTANPRGRASSRAVEVNQQLEFNLDIVGAVLSDMSAERDGDVRTWFLLYYRSETAGLRAEVSLPVRGHDRGVVDKWSDRIILDPLTFDPATVIPQDAGVNDDVEFDIEAV